MSTVQRNRLAVLAATVLLLVAGLITLTVTITDSSTDIRAVAAAAHLHHGVTAPSVSRTLAVTGHEIHQLDEGILAAIVLMVASFGVLSHARLRNVRPNRLTLGGPLSRAPPTSS